MRCIARAVETPPQTGERVRIVNQMTETHRVRDLAENVSALTGTPVASLDNPRKEAEENELHAPNDTLLRFGLAPIRLNDRLLTEVTEIAQLYPAASTPTRSPASPAGSGRKAHLCAGAGPVRHLRLRRFDIPSGSA